LIVGSKSKVMHAVEPAVCGLHWFVDGTEN